MIQRFTVRTRKFGSSRNCFELHDIQTGECARILPFLGGAINQLRLRINGQLGDLVRGYKDEEEIAELHGRTFRSAQLYPFPNRVAKGQYNFGGHSYQLPINFPAENNAIHGLVHDRLFTPINSNEGTGESSLTLQYRQENSQDPGYPFSFALEVTYRLSERGLQIETTLTNTDSVGSPVGYGWHPYFILGNTAIDDLMLCLPATQSLETDTNMIPTGRLLPFPRFRRPERIGNRVFDHCLSCTTHDSHSIYLTDADGHGIRLDLDQGYRYIQIYTPPERNCIAIEPMSCAPDSFNNGLGGRTLGSGERLRMVWRIGSYTRDAF